MDEAPHAQPPTRLHAHAAVPPAPPRRRRAGREGRGRVPRPRAHHQRESPRAPRARRPGPLSPVRARARTQIGSIEGEQCVPMHETYAYQASKAGLHHLSKSFAGRLGPEGITSNTLACGTSPRCAPPVRRAAHSDVPSQARSPAKVSVPLCDPPRVRPPLPARIPVCSLPFADRPPQ